MTGRITTRFEHNNSGRKLCPFLCIYSEKILSGSTNYSAALLIPILTEEHKSGIITLLALKLLDRFKPFHEYCLSKYKGYLFSELQDFN